MNILYISYDGMTDTLGQSQVIPYLVGLQQKGYSIAIVSCEKKERYHHYKDVVQKLLIQHKILWYPVRYSSLPSLLSKQKNLFLLKKKVNELCKAILPDIIHCRSYMAALIGLQMKNKYGTKFIFDMRGFWADERIDGQIWNLNNSLHKRIYSYFKKKEIEFLLNADYTISLTNNAKNELFSWKLIKQKNISIQVIPCCVDLNLFSYFSIRLSEQEELKKQLSILPNDFVISYLGSIGTWYMLEEMLDFFKALLLEKTEAKFLFITPDSRHEILEKAKEKEIPSNKIIVRSVDRKEVPLYLSISACSIYFIKPLYSKKASSPTKTGEIMAMGIPIITNAGIGDTDEIVKSKSTGILINDFSATEYNRAIKEMDVLLNVDKANIRAVAQRYFSLEKGVELYDGVYEKLKTKK